MGPLKGPDLRGKVFTAMTGRIGVDVSGRGEDIRGMLLAVGGASAKTASRIDLTRAARSLGVSRRTVERWVKTAATGVGQRPSAKHLQVLTRKARQVASTQAGRRASAQRIRQSGKFSAGARLAINGEQGPFRAGQEYSRKRITQLVLDPHDADAMLAAWEQRGEQGFMDWATTHYDQQYLDDWSFQSIDDIAIDAPFGGGGR